MGKAEDGGSTVQMIYMLLQIQLITGYKEISTILGCIHSQTAARIRF
jgi:hypothetical protein